MKTVEPRVVSGRARSVGQKSIETRSLDANGGTTTHKSQGIALRLDAVELPLMLNTGKAADIFIARDDALEIACLAHPDRLEIHGIRNQTDGSIYLARTASVASARMEIAIRLWTLAASSIIEGGLALCGMGRDFLAIIWWLGVAFPAALCVVGAIGRLFGFAAMPDARGHAQPGGRREMNAARQALAITHEERRRIRFV